MTAGGVTAAAAGPAGFPSGVVSSSDAGSRQLGGRAVRTPRLGGITRGQPSGPGMAATGSGSSLDVTWPVNPAAGSKVLLAVLAGATPTGVTDNGTSPAAFTADSSDTATPNKVFLYRADAITLPGSGGYKVTVALASPHTITAAGIAYTGVAPGAPAAANSNDAANNGPVSTGAAAPAAAGALIFAAFGDLLASGTDTIALTNASFAEQFTETDATDFITGAVADWINPAGPAAANCTWTVGNAVTFWAGVIAAYDHA